MTDFIKNRPWLYRGLRTFFQAFLSTFAAQFVMMNESGFDKKLLFSAVVSALAAGLSAVMNLNEKSEVRENAC